MARYPLNLPRELKKEAEVWAAKQKFSLNQFIMWAVAEKVGMLKQDLDDVQFPKITYRRGAAGIPTPTIRGTGLRVQTIVVAKQSWEMTVQIENFLSATNDVPPGLRLLSIPSRGDRQSHRC